MSSFSTHKEEEDGLDLKDDNDVKGAKTNKRNSYVPKILQKWKNWCLPKQGARNITLTPQNACIYAKTGSNIGWKGRIEHALEYMEQGSELDANLLASLLECVITTVIGLATDQQPPDEYLFCSLVYLQQIKNEFGENPPNIAAFVKLVESKLTDESRDTLQKMGKADLRLVPSDIVITRLPKGLQKRLCK